MAHTIVALLQNRPGVLHRAVSLLRRRGYNIESLTVGRSERTGVSRMTLVVDADDVEQVVKQLYRLVEVLRVSDVTNDPTVEREAALIKIDAPDGKLPSVIALATSYGAKIADAGRDAIMIEMTGAPDKVDGFLEKLRPFGIRELMRTGRIAMVRGAPAHSAADASGLPHDDITEPGRWLSQADGII
jgi:acetolactate synthase-1/3 small subunit